MPHANSPSALTSAHRLRRVVNAANLSTPLGLVIAATGRARCRRGPRGLILAEGYRLTFPRAGAFTVGNVILTSSSLPRLDERNPGTLDHEDAHAWQYLAWGLPFLPLYGLASVWSWLRTGDWASANGFERHAGLSDGGYPEHPVTNAGFKRLAATARATVPPTRRPRVI